MLINLRSLKLDIDFIELFPLNSIFIVNNCFYSFIVILKQLIKSKLLL